ncbi:MAG TPA: hypothetical protein VEI58_11260 [Chthoniobacterales bacterium]|nr:hypothetical protein [Chthoniobacterales bacterium]
MNVPTINEVRKLSAPTMTPQALAWDGAHLWMSSRDLGTLYKVDAEKWKIVEEIDPPGIVWAGVATKDAMHFTIGKGLNDDRYVYRYSPEKGFSKLFACPDLTGSYLSYDGANLYFSQWYTGNIHQVDGSGKILRTINVGAEICGHVFVDGMIYVIRGKENKDLPDKSEEWRIGRLNAKEKTPVVEDLATVPFAARSLTFDGEHFWSNHRAANETVVFDLPA